MPDTSTLIHFAVLGACALAFAAAIGLVLNKFRLSYVAGLLCGCAVGFSVVAGLYLEEGLAYPPERDWHHIMWAMFAVGILAGLMQIAVWQSFVDAAILAGATVLCSQALLPVVGSDQVFDDYRFFWLGAPVVAAAANIYLLRTKMIDGSAVWGFWIVVAQLAIVSVALMLSYGTLAGVSIGILTMSLILSVAVTLLYALSSGCTARVDVASPAEAALSSHSQNAASNIAWLYVAAGPLAVAAVLLTICVRTYSYGMIAGWPYVPMLFLPTIVCVADSMLFSKLRSGQRLAIAIALTSVISASTIVYMIVNSSPEA